jgi:hypothetical protein
MKKYLISLTIFLLSCGIKEKQPVEWYDTRDFTSRPVTIDIAPTPILIFYVDTLAHLYINSANGTGQMELDDNVHWEPGFYINGSDNPIYDTTFHNLSANKHIFYVFLRTKQANP